MDGDSPRVESWFWRRLRWRLRGAALWPAFFLLIVVDGLLLVLLPPYGDDGPGDLLGGLLLAGFANLFVVAVLAPLGALVLRRFRPTLPRVIAVDRAGTALLVAFAAFLAVAGLAHRPAVAGERRDEQAVAAAVHTYVNASAKECADGLPAADRMQLEPDLYRACVPGDDPKRPLCLFVETDQQPASVTIDTDRAPNSAYRSWGGFD